MKIAATFNPLSATSGTFNAGFTSGKYRVVIYNQSNVNLMLGWDAFTTYLPAWTVMLYCINTGRGGAINWSQQSILQMFNSPVSLVTVELYQPNEEIVGTFPAPVQHQSAVSLTGNTQVTFTASIGFGATAQIKQILNLFNPANSGVTYTFHSARVFTNDNTTPTCNLALINGADSNLGTAVPIVCHNGTASPLVSTAHATASDQAGGIIGANPIIEVVNVQQNVTQDMLAFPDSVALTPGNNLVMELSSGASGHVVRLTLKYSEGQAPAPILATGSGAGLTVANQLIQTNQGAGTTLIQSGVSGQAGNAWFVTNDGLATLQALQAGVYHQILKAQGTGNPLLLGQTGDITEVLGKLLVDSGILIAAGNDQIFQSPSGTEIGRVNNIGQYSHTLASTPSVNGTAGTLKLFQPFKGANFKFVIAQFSGFQGNGTQTLALLTAFATRAWIFATGLPSTGIKFTSGGVAQTMDVLTTIVPASPGGTTTAETILFSNSIAQVRTGFDSVQVVTGDANTSTSLMLIIGF